MLDTITMLELFPHETTHSVRHLLLHFIGGGLSHSLSGGLLHLLTHGINGIVESATVVVSRQKRDGRIMLIGWF